MIIYDLGEYQLSFIFRMDGSLLPKAVAFASPSTALALALRYALSNGLLGIETDRLQPGSSMVWTVTFFVLSMLLSFRCNKAYARFWDGCTLVQAMSAEWFESCSNLMAFACLPLKRNPGKKDVMQRVTEFQFRLIRLMSLLHGVALRQIGGDDGEELEILDIFGLDDKSFDYLKVTCEKFEINRVEVILHWIQVLITESIDDGVLIVPPPILTRAYQTLSRGMVNLHSVRRIADIPFPFPLTQALIVLLLIHSVLTPIVISFFFKNYVWCGVITFLPLFGMWSLVFICGQLEQPFGTDANDLPLSMQQFDFNNSLMMLVDSAANVVPTLKSDAARNVVDLRSLFGNQDSMTHALFSDENIHDTLREHLKDSRCRHVRGSTVYHRTEDENGSLPRAPSSHFSSPQSSTVQQILSRQHSKTTLATYQEPDQQSQSGTQSNQNGAGLPRSRSGVSVSRIPEVEEEEAGMPEEPPASFENPPPPAAPHDNVNAVMLTRAAEAVTLAAAAMEHLVEDKDKDHDRKVDAHAVEVSQTSIKLPMGSGLMSAPRLPALSTPVDGMVRDPGSEPLPPLVGDDHRVDGFPSPADTTIDIRVAGDPGEEQAPRSQPRIPVAPPPLGLKHYPLSGVGTEVYSCQARQRGIVMPTVSEEEHVFNEGMSSQAPPPSEGGAAFGVSQLDSGATPAFLPQRARFLLSPPVDSAVANASGNRHEIPGA